jgi:hypothetical protein
MRKLLLSLTLIVFLGMTSCKKEIKGNEVATDTTAVVVDTSAATKIVDPDPTDTIPAERYGINSSNPKTADLIRLTIKDLYKDDLAKNSIDDYSKKFYFL